MPERSPEFIHDASGNRVIKNLCFVLLIELGGGAIRQIEAFHTLIFPRFVLVLVGCCQLAQLTDLEIQSAKNVRIPFGGHDIGIRELRAVSPGTGPQWFSGRPSPVQRNPRR
jgi:hypothetical protein